MGPGKRNLIGFIVLVLLALIGVLIWGFFAQWPRARWEAWRARRQRAARSRRTDRNKNISVVVVHPDKRKPCTSVLVLESKYPLDGDGSKAGSLASAGSKGSGQSMLSPKSIDDDGSSSILSNDSHEKSGASSSLLLVPQTPFLAVPLKVKFSDPLIAVCSPPMR